MAEYIERDALMLRIKEIHCAECDSYNGVRCRACWVDDTLDYIDSEPAADVAPVVHGEWIKDHDYLKCPECSVMVKRDFTFFDIGDWNYCPNCGARMDGAE